MPSARLSWEAVPSSNAGDAPTFPENVSRAKVPGGWLVYTEELFYDEEEKVDGVSATALAFVPDAKHEWGTAY